MNRHREILEKELETVGIRLNQKKPDVTLAKRKTGGGVRFASTVPQTKLGPDPEKVVTQVLREYKINSADVLAREEITVDQLVDVIQGNREYKPCLYLYNKIDTITIEEIDQLARMPHSIVGSVSQNFNIGEPLEDDLLKQKLWQYLGLTRIYTKRKGKFEMLNDFCKSSRNTHICFQSRFPTRSGRASRIVRYSERNNSKVIVCQYFYTVIERLQLCFGLGYKCETCTSAMWAKPQT